MMGKNTLTLNQQTMVEAVQVWVNQTFTTPPTVVLVTKIEDYSGDTHSFAVSLEVTEKKV